jgi:hypothetical protein
MTRGYATISSRTEKIKGLHENDFITTAKIDCLAGECGAQENRPRQGGSPAAPASGTQKSNTG